LGHGRELKKGGHHPPWLLIGLAQEGPLWGLRVSSGGTMGTIFRARQTKAGASTISSTLQPNGFWGFQIQPPEGTGRGRITPGPVGGTRKSVRFAAAFKLQKRPARQEWGHFGPGQPLRGRWGGDWAVFSKSEFAAPKKTPSRSVTEAIKRALGAQGSGGQSWDGPGPINPFRASPSGFPRSIFWKQGMLEKPNKKPHGPPYSHWLEIVGKTG